MFGWNVRSIGMSELVLLDKVIISVIFWKMTGAKLDKQRVEGQMVITIIIVLIYSHKYEDW